MRQNQNVLRPDQVIVPEQGETLMFHPATQSSAEFERELLKNWLKEQKGWKSQTACQNVDKEIFFDPEQVEKAKKFCGRCAVSTECLMEGVVLYPQDEGVRARLTYEERTLNKR